MTITLFCYVCKEPITVPDEKEFRKTGHESEKVKELPKTRDIGTFWSNYMKKQRLAAAEEARAAAAKADGDEPDA